MFKPCHNNRVKDPCVYIMASGHHGTLYIGVTSDIAHRAWQHHTGELGGFTARYGCKRLVWMERHDTMEQAIAREKRLKKWERAWKVRLIEESNPHWHPVDSETEEPVEEARFEQLMRGGWVDKDGNAPRESG